MGGTANDTVLGNRSFSFFKKMKMSCGEREEVMCGGTITSIHIWIH